MRLTNEFRDELIGRALKHAFAKREKAHADATTALADEVYRLTHGEAEKIAKKLPQGWINSASYIQIEAAGFHYAPNRTGLQDRSLKMSKAHFFPLHGANAVALGGAHPLNDQAQAVATEHAAIRDEKEALRVKIHALVYACTTIAKLRDAWPECERFLPAAAPKPSTALVPVELVPDLNKALGLSGGTK